MPSTGWTPRIVPYGADQTVYLVIDRFGGLGTVYRETEVERADLETIIADLMTGQFNDPIRVVAFNTLEHWSANVSEDIATEIYNTNFGAPALGDQTTQISVPDRATCCRRCHRSRAAIGDRRRITSRAYRLASHRRGARQVAADRGFLRPLPLPLRRRLTR